MAENNNDESIAEGLECEPDEETIEEALSQERDREEEYLASLQRAQADLSNYIKRAEREKLEIVESANRALILNLLPVLDDFERAFNSQPAKFARSSWTEGVRLIYNKTKSILETQGLTRIEAVGETFDPHVHEAIAQAEGEEGVVLEEARTGYMFKDKLLRPSSVVVGREQQEKIGEESMINGG